MPRTLPMLALVVLSTGAFAFGQGSSSTSNTRYTIVKLKAPSPPSTTPTDPPPTTTPPSTTPTDPSSPPSTTPTDPSSPPSSTPPSTTPTSSACSAMDLGAGANLNGYLPFDSNNPWRQNIANAPVDSNSANLINFIGGASLKANFGAPYDGTLWGIPYTVVSGTPFVNINYTAYGDESDPGPMPFTNATPVEGDPGLDGDRHSLVLDRDNCWLYEIGGAFPQGDGTWQAAAGAVWDLTNQNARPFTWTSTDAAGLPVFPGLVRYDEVAAGHVDHAIRITLLHSRQAFVSPATHWAPSSSDSNAAPMGMRMRLKASYDISSFPPQAKVILTALKNYGAIMADNGSNMFLIGAPDNRWDNDDLNTLRQVPASAFEVVQMGTVYTPSNIPQGSAPNITSFTADNLTVSAGTAVTLSWAADNASYYVLSPEVGAVRGNTATVHPTVTTTYTLYATNQFDRSSKTITITVQ